MARTHVFNTDVPEHVRLGERHDTFVRIAQRRAGDDVRRGLDQRRRWS